MSYIVLFVDGDGTVSIGDGIVARHVVAGTVADSSQRRCQGNTRTRIGRRRRQGDAAQDMRCYQTADRYLVGCRTDGLTIGDGLGISRHGQGLRCDGEILHHITAIVTFQHDECPCRIGTSLHVILIAYFVVGISRQGCSAVIHSDGGSLRRAVIGLVGDGLHGDVRIGVRSRDGQRTSLVGNIVVRRHVGLASHDPGTTDSDTRRIVARSRIGSTH